MTQGKGGTLRQVMPQTAELVDWLREEFGAETADKILLRGKQGKGGFYAAEIGPDGVLREFGSTQDGRRATFDAEGRAQWSKGTAAVNPPLTTANPRRARP